MEIWIAFLLWAAGLGTVLLGTYLAFRHLIKGRPTLDAPFRLYPVSVLKPLKGVDEGLEQTWRPFSI